MNIQKEREAFSNWHESEYGEHVTWWDEVPASHIHNDRWVGWKASALRASEKLEGCVVVPVEPTQKMLDAFPEVEYEDTYKGTCSIWVDDLTLMKGYKAMVEAARGGNE